jgi:hypothetical protein
MGTLCCVSVPPPPETTVVTLVGYSRRVALKEGGI